ncbi:MAG: tetratricopeptide repeat protein [Treponemataceae bacterium]
MKNPKRVLAIFIALILVAGLGFAAFSFMRPSNIVQRIAGISPDGSPPETIEGLRSAIGAYESKVAETISAAAQAGIYWKILAVRYMDRGMYGESLDALNSAVTYFPEDATLHYLIGICAAVMSKSSYDYAGTGRNKEKERLLALAESAQKRAIALDSKYSRPLYALGVLLVFELDRAVEAVPYLERYLSMQTKDVDAMFILARAYYVTGRRDESVTLYDRILSLTKDEKKRTEAISNKKTVLDRQYGSK